MKTFKQLLSELYHAVEVNPNIDSTENLTNLNRYLDNVLDTDFYDPMTGLHKIKKTLSLYGIQINHPDIKNDSGTIKMPVSVFQTHDEFEGVEDEPTHVVIYKYNTKDGKVRSSAEVKKL